LVETQVNDKERRRKSCFQAQRKTILSNLSKVSFSFEDILFISHRTIDKDLVNYHLTELDTKISIKLPQASVSVDEVQNLNKNLVDSTGIKLWPAEEIMAYYISHNLDLFKGKTVIELGAGYSGLASLVLAAYLIRDGSTSNIAITDGLDICAERIKENLDLNPQIKKHFDINVEGERIAQAEGNSLGVMDIKKLVWSREIKSELKYNILILSDCLFFKKFHIDLEATLYELLDDNPESFCLFANPQRGDSCKLFFELAKERFTIVEMERGAFIQEQIEKMSTQSDYDADTDDIRIYKLQKKN